MSAPVITTHLSTDDADLFVIRYERVTYTVFQTIEQSWFVDPSSHVYELEDGTPFHDAIIKAIFEYVNGSS